MARGSKISISQKQAFFYISVLLFVMMLLPLFIIGHYNFMSVDDYPYMQSSIESWRANHSLIDVLVKQFMYAYSYYFSWQGTFSMEWLGTSFMVMIGEHCYYLGTYATLGTFVISELILFNLIGTKVFGADKYDTGIVTLWLIGFQVMMVPYPVEAFYWLCGALLYTMGYSTTAFVYALMFLFLRRRMEDVGELTVSAGRKRLVIDILIQAGIIFGSFIVAFGNFVSAIFGFSSFILLVAAVHFKKMRGRLMATIDALVYTIFFVLNVMAPGNRERTTYEGAAQVSAVKAVVKGILAAAEYMVVNFYPTIVILLLMMLPFIIGIVKKKAFGEKKSFAYPLAFSIVSFGLYACQFVPTQYSLGILGAGRVQNMYRFTLYILYFVNVIYWTGYVLRRLSQDHPEFTEEVLKPKKSVLLPYLAIMFCILCFSANLYGGARMTAVSAFDSLRTGQAGLYYSEYESRLEVMHDDSIREAYVDKFTDPPYVLFFGDIKEDYTAWENRSMALFYGKDNVYLRP